MFSSQSTPRIWIGFAVVASILFVFFLAWRFVLRPSTDRPQVPSTRLPYERPLIRVILPKLPPVESEKPPSQSISDSVKVGSDVEFEASFESNAQMASTFAMNLVDASGRRRPAGLLVRLKGATVYHSVDPILLSQCGEYRVVLTPMRESEKSLTLPFILRVTN